MSNPDIEPSILSIRSHRVILDADLARLYGVPTKVLNQAVKRNKGRFPRDFMFQLSTHEKEEVVTNCDHLSGLKFSPTLPYAFTEHGALMAGHVLNSSQAIQVSIWVVRTFVKLRADLSATRELAHKLAELEAKYEKHDHNIAAIFEAIRQLMAIPEKPKRQIGFHPHDSARRGACR